MPALPVIANESGGLPALPTVPTPSAAPSPAAGGAAAPSGAQVSTAGSAPPTSALPPPPPTDGGADTAETASAQPLPPPLPAPADTMVTTASTALDAAPGLPALPGLDAAAESSALPSGIAPLPLPGEATSLPEIAVERETSKAPSLKSWETTLATTVVIPETNFIYKRARLPAVIYRDAYDRENRHLPRRTTREDYANLLFNSVARNDVETTRALLNAGTSLQWITERGETPLMLAQRRGAMDVAALLVARGAQ